MPLHTDKRPDNLDDLMGNDGIKEAIKMSLARQDKPHSWMFVGPAGCGKTTMARIVAKMIGCHTDDIAEYNSANTRGIETIRDLIQSTYYMPTRSQYKIYILDEAHKITSDGQNALLKTLEEPPSHCFFVICTTDPDKVIKAIRTRCAMYEMKTLASPYMKKLIENTLVSEGIQVEDFPKEVVNQIIKSADGCPRQALILLDSVIDIEDEKTALNAISEATNNEKTSIDICRTLLDKRKNRWLDMKYYLKGFDEEPEKIRYAVLGYLAACLLSDKNDAATDAHISQVIDCFTESFMYSGKAGFYNACYQACLI